MRKLMAVDAERANRSVGRLRNASRASIAATEARGLTSVTTLATRRTRSSENIYLKAKRFGIMRHWRCRDWKRQACTFSMVWSSLEATKSRNFSHPRWRRAITWELRSCTIWDCIRTLGEETDRNTHSCLIYDETKKGRHKIKINGSNDPVDGLPRENATNFPTAKLKRPSKPLTFVENYTGKAWITELRCSVIQPECPMACRRIWIDN